jgi:predicted nucleic acid-binding protein
VIALLDNTVLSNFVLIGETNLLPIALGDTANTTVQVLAEFQAGVATGKLPSTESSWLPALSLTDEELPIYQELRAHLNAGEAACLAVATQKKCIVFTDDRDARKLAVQMQIPVSGTIGVLLRLVDLVHLPSR